jgi:DNA polymerase I
MNFMLVDGNNLAYRGYFVLKDAGLTNPEGRAICMEMSFLKILIKYLKEHKPSHLCIVFDSGRCRYRESLYEGYKKKRRDGPRLADIKEQKDYTVKMCSEILKVKTAIIPNTEADDIIAVLSKQITSRGDACFIVSNDHDMHQLLTGSKVTIVKNDGILTRDDIIEKYNGIQPERLPEVWALSGDTSDEIPGVPGIGEKTAIKIINKYGSLENALENEPKLKGFEDDIKIYHKLVTPIEVDINVDYEASELSHLYSDWRLWPEIMKYLESNDFQQILKMVKNNGIFGKSDQLELF